MAIHKKEVEVEYPDCGICGKDIGEDEHLRLSLEVRRDQISYSGLEIQVEILVCENCVINSRWKGRLDELAEVSIGGIKWPRKSNKKGK